MKVMLCWPYRLEQSIFSEDGQQEVIAADQTWHGFPLGIGYMGSYLSDRGVEVVLYDFSFHTWDKVMEVLRREAPDILGITCHTSQRAAVWNMCEYMKETNPSCLTVVGGYHISAMWKQVMRNYEFVDYGVVGDGAYALLALAHGECEEEVPGLVYRTDDALQCNTAEHLPPDDYPFMKYELFNWQDEEVRPYFKDGDNSSLANLNYHNISTGKGCYARCNFCCVHRVWDTAHRKSAQRIYDEMKHYHDTYGHPQGWYKFVDETLPINSRAAKELCELLIDSPIDFKWECYMRGDVRELERMELLRNAGLFSVAIGVESGSQRILDNIGKGVDIEGIYDTFQYAHMSGINTFCLLIVGSIGEDEESITDTKKLILDLRPGNMGISYYTIFPDTDLYDYCVDKGIIDDSYWLTDRYPPLYLAEQNFETLQRWRDDVYNTWRVEVALKRKSPYYGPESPLLPEYRSETPINTTSDLLDCATYTSNFNFGESTKLSGYTIVSDDEVAIPCIRSMLDVCDDVAVIMNRPSSFIRDVVMEMAARNSCLRVVDVPYDFIGANEYLLRNLGIELCAGEWILEVDSDEVLYNGQYQAIRDCTRNDDALMHIFKCNQFCGDSHHLQFLPRRNEELDPVLDSYYGWGECVVNGYTNHNHIMLYRKGPLAVYNANGGFRYGLHSFLSYKINQDMSRTANHDNIRYCHYSLCQSKLDIYRRFLLYATSDLSVANGPMRRVPVTELPIPKDEVERIYANNVDGSDMLIPEHFIMNPDNPLGSSPDFRVMTFHGEHPVYMKGHPIMGRRVATEFDEHGSEVIVRHSDSNLPQGRVRIGVVSSFDRVYDFRVFDMPVDLKRRLHEYTAIISEDYYTFTAEASSINADVFMIARELSNFRNNYVDVVHDNVRYILTIPEYVSPLTKMGAPIEKIVWSIDISDMNDVIEFIHSIIGGLK